MVGIAYNRAVTGRDLTKVDDMWDPAFKGKVSLLADLQDGLGMFMMAQGNTPDERRFSFTDGVCLLDDKLLLIKHGKLQLLDPGDQREVSQLPAITVPGHRLRGRPTTDGKQLALSRRPDQKVELYDITDLQHPKPIREYDLKRHPGACRFWNNQLLIPAGYQGLLLERKTKP